MALESAQARTFNKALRETEALNKRLIAIYNRSLKNVRSKLSRYKSEITKTQLKKLESDLTRELSALTDQSRELIRISSEDALRQTYYKNGYSYERWSNIGRSDQYALGYSTLNQRAVNAAVTKEVGGLTFQKRTAKEKKRLNKKVQNVIAEAEAAGKGIPETARALKGVDDIYSTAKNRAVMTARTERLRAYSIGDDQARDVAVDAGVELTDTWDASLDGVTRIDHRLLDQTHPNEEDYFLFASGGQTKTPRRSGIAAQDIQCRCYKRSDPYGFSPDTRRARKLDGSWEDIEGRTSYEEWMKNKGLDINGKPLPGEKPAGKTKAKAKIKKAAPKAPETIARNYNSNLSKNIGKEHYDTLHDLIDKSPDTELARVWDKYEDQIKVGNINLRKTAYYNPGKGDISFNLKKEMVAGKYNAKAQTVFHESGHAIDYAIAREKGHVFTGYSNVYKDGLYTKTINKEIADRIDGYGVKIKASLNAHQTDYKWLLDNNYLDSWSYNRWKDQGIVPQKVRYRKFFARRQLQKEISDLPILEKRNFSDILEGSTKGDIQAGFGHGKAYWKRDAGRVGKEAFAEMFDATFSNPIELETFKKYIPKSYKVFQEMIKGL